MIRIYQFSVVTLLFLALPSMVLAQGPEGKKDDPPDIKTIYEILKVMNGDMKESFKKISFDMSNIVADMQSLKTSNNVLREDLAAATKRIDLLERELRFLRADLDSLKKPNGSNGSAADKIVLDEIRSKVNQIDQTLARLQTLTSREAKSPPPPVQKGRILLANHYFDEMTFHINDKRWVVPAKSTVLIEEMPVGTFSYKVTHAKFGERFSNPAATLNPGQTYTLTVRD
jgi:hypothetical protein